MDLEKFSRNKCEVNLDEFTQYASSHSNLQLFTRCLKVKYTDFSVLDMVSQSVSDYCCLSGVPLKLKGHSNYAYIPFKCRKP